MGLFFELLKALPEGRPAVSPPHPHDQGGWHSQKQEAEGPPGHRLEIGNARSETAGDAVAESPLFWLAESLHSADAASNCCNRRDYSTPMKFEVSEPPGWLGD